MAELTLGERIRNHPSYQVIQFRDFRLLWLGSFLSFIGSRVQDIAQGWLVYDMTKDPWKLAMIGFYGTIPVFLTAPFMGALVDSLNRRKVLIFCQCVFAVSALSLAFLLHTGRLRYEHIVVVAVVNGLSSSLEMPTRQSLVSSVVPLDRIHAAVPLNAMTFNLARVLGPSLGAMLLALFGPVSCYTFNGISYLCLIFAVLAIRADLTSTTKNTEPMIDLMVEGMRYTWHEKRLKMLFLMEMTVSICALFYLNLMPAIAKDMFHLAEKGLGAMMSTIGVGAITGLVMVSILSNKPYRSHIVRYAMASIGLSLFVLSLTPPTPIAFLCLGVAGASSVAQLNSTNSLFQTLAPERLRGRVLAMHIWALSGIGPLGLPLIGYLAQQYGVDVTLRGGATVVLIGALVSYFNRATLAGVDTPSTIS
ncbi:MAG: MFS transporter [Armatimonadetes bacterium]|nr:MFS transporter [Armatimonadota bacterium]